MWRGIKWLSSWRCDQVCAARFQSSAAFRTGRAVASHCGTAVSSQSISAEPGGPGKKWGARATAWPCSSPALPPRESHMVPTLSLHRETLRKDAQRANPVMVSQEFKPTSQFRQSSYANPAPSSPIYLQEHRSVALVLFSSLFILWSTWPFGKENAIDWLLQSSIALKC